MATQKLNAVDESFYQNNGSADDFVSAILQHEGLLSGQTPFRITNDAMANWDTIHGFRVNRRIVKPADRQNFIYLEDPKQVPLAVKEQFKKYADVPGNYGLPRNPTVAQAIAKFDQTGAKGKLKYLQDRGFDPNELLANLLR